MTAPGLDRVHDELQKLVGLELVVASRAANMLDLGFGRLITVVGRAGRNKGKERLVGEVVLHVQCPWRVEGPDGGIVTGRADLWETADGSLPDYDTYDYDEVPNLQDRRMAEWLDLPDLPRKHPDRSHPRRRLHVVAARVTCCEGAEIDLSDGSRLTIFPDNNGEAWRLFRMGDPDDDAPHFVAGGGRFGADRD